MKRMDSHKKKLRVIRLIVHLAGILPALGLALAALTNHLTANPIQAATQRTGDMAIILLILSLACTPLYTLTGARFLVGLNKPLGLYAFGYAALHFLLYTGVDFGFSLRFLIPEFLEKRYLWAGLPALLILLVLAATSFKSSQRKLGRTWKKLHRLVYLAAALVVLHLAWVVKGDVSRFTGDIWKPLAAGISLTLLLALRLPPVTRLIKNLRNRSAP